MRVVRVVSRLFPLTFRLAFYFALYMYPQYTMYVVHLIVVHVFIRSGIDAVTTMVNDDT